MAKVAAGGIAVGDGSKGVSSLYLQITGLNVLHPKSNMAKGESRDRIVSARQVHQLGDNEDIRSVIFLLPATHCTPILHTLIWIFGVSIIYIDTSSTGKIQVLYFINEQNIK